jgi:hypothetical protein
VNLDELEQKAKAAIPRNYGPEKPLGPGLEQYDFLRERILRYGTGGGDFFQAPTVEFASYIAALSPDVALKLIAVAKAARSVRFGEVPWVTFQNAVDALELP